MVIEIAEIWSHPVKSCRGRQVNVVGVNGSGVVNDRLFVVVRDEADRLAMTQRNLPKMAQITAVLYTTGGTPFYVELSAPGMPTLTVWAVQHLPKPVNTFASVFGDRVPGYDCGDEVAAWLSQFLGRPCRLVQRNYVQQRVTVKRVPQMTTEIGFQDRTPFLVIGEESIARMNAHARANFNATWWRTAANYRMTFLTCGTAPFAELHWNEIDVMGEDGTPIELVGRKRCDRCGVPDKDEKTGEPLVTPSVIDVLTDMGQVLPLYPDDCGSEKAAVLGMGFMMFPAQQFGRISVGSQVIVQSEWPRP